MEYFKRLLSATLAKSVSARIAADFWRFLIQKMRKMVIARVEMNGVEPRNVAPSIIWVKNGVLSE